MALQINKYGGDQPEDDFRGEPGVVLLHCAYQPATGRIGLFRSNRNVPPSTPTEFKVELDNHFTTLANCMASLIGFVIRQGAPRVKLIDALLLTINRFLDGGVLDGERQKIFVDSIGDKKNKVDDATLTKINYDEELYGFGFLKLTSRPWLKMLENADFDRNKEAANAPKDISFHGKLTFRKVIEVPGCEKPLILEASRDEDLLRGPQDENYSRYAVSLVHENGSILSRTQWNMIEPDKITQHLAVIQAEAEKLWFIYQNNQSA